MKELLLRPSHSCKCPLYLACYVTCTDSNVPLLLLLLLGFRLGVVHRDIKPENFLLGAPTLLSTPAGTAASVLKISDFGVSAFFQPGEVSSSTSVSLLYSEYCRGFLLCC